MGAAEAGRTSPPKDENTSRAVATRRPAHTWNGPTTGRRAAVRPAIHAVASITTHSKSTSHAIQQTKAAPLTIVASETLLWARACMIADHRGIDVGSGHPARLSNAAGTPTSSPARAANAARPRVSSLFLSLVFIIGSPARRHERYGRTRVRER